MPISDALAPLLDGLTDDKVGRVFPGSEDGLRQAFRRATAKARIVDFRFHDLRHCTATAMRRAGADLDVIRRALGHSSLAMALRYAHAGDRDVHAALAAVGQINGGPMVDGPRLKLVR